MESVFQQQYRLLLQAAQQGKNDKNEQDPDQLALWSAWDFALSSGARERSLLLLLERIATDYSCELKMDTFTALAEELDRFNAPLKAALQHIREQTTPMQTRLREGFHPTSENTATIDCSASEAGLVRDIANNENLAARLRHHGSRNVKGGGGGSRSRDGNLVALDRYLQMTTGGKVTAEQAARFVEGATRIAGLTNWPDDISASWLRGRISAYERSEMKRNLIHIERDVANLILSDVLRDKKDKNSRDMQERIVDLLFAMEHAETIDENVERKLGKQSDGKGTAREMIRRAVARLLTAARGEGPWSSISTHP